MEIALLAALPGQKGPEAGSNFLRKWRRRESNPIRVIPVTYRWRKTFGPKRLPSSQLPPPTLSPRVSLSPLECTPVVETFWRQLSSSDTESLKIKVAHFSDVGR